MDTEQKKTDIATLGEFGLIDRISKSTDLKNKSSVRGIGDDAAVLSFDEGQYTLLATDMLIERVHFDLSYVPLQHIGYKAVVTNVSDIIAMNGYPTQIVVSLGLSNRFSVDAVDLLYKGIKAACNAFQVDLVGGDTTTSASGLVISIAVLGRVDKDYITYRSGAKPNEIICVTGDLGGAYVGLQILEREKEVFLTDDKMQPQLDAYQYVVGRQLKPEPRIDIVRELKKLELKPTAMIDVSDGLGSELLHLSTHAEVGVKIFEDKMPIDKQTYEVAALEMKIDPITAVLNGGEDYELLFTVSQEDFEKIKHHRDIHFIGHTHDKTDRNVLVTKQGAEVPVQAQGWAHFSS